MKKMLGRTLAVTGGALLLAAVAAPAQAHSWDDHNVAVHSSLGAVGSADPVFGAVWNNGTATAGHVDVCWESWAWANSTHGGTGGNADVVIH